MRTLAPGLRPAALTLLALLALACSGSNEPARGQPPAPAPPLVPIDTSFLDGADASAWVAIYDPEKAWNGFTLDLYRRRIPILFDMNGRIVHAWPEARVKSRVRLLPDGSILAIARGRAVVEYDWEGRQVWEYRLEDAIPHHDVVRLENGHTLLVVRKKGIGWDDLLEVDRDGATVWTWRSAEHLRAFAGDNPKGDVTHVNSVQELPDNPWFERGDARFRPGNLLLSARNLNRIFVIDKATGDVVWSFAERLDLQHEAVMIEPGLPDAGHVLVLSNGFRGTYAYRRSAILEIDPVEATIDWEYRADGFFTPTGGVEQPLPNGDVLVTSDRGGRIFEIARDGAIVWQWTPPFSPTRARRYAADYCPQLAAFGLPDGEAVAAPAGYRYVDRPAYRFAARKSRRTVKHAGEKKRILAGTRECSLLLLPSSARLDVEYGLDRKRIRHADHRDREARFTVRLREEETGVEKRLVDDRVTLEHSPHRQRTLDLGPWAQRWVRLCVDAEADQDSEPFVYWTVPSITTAADRDLQDEESDDDEGLSDEERQTRAEHLKALGYVD